MPTLPSPDTVLVVAADRLAAVPQRRGLPLPAVLAPLPLLDGAGYALLAIVMASYPVPGPSGLLPCLAVAAIAVTKAATGMRESRRRLADARGWSPDMAGRYRATALATREIGAHRRYLNLVTTLAMASMAAGLSLGAWPPGMGLGLGCLAVSAFGWLADSYGECVIPRDPDLAARRPAGAGAP